MSGCEGRQPPILPIFYLRQRILRHFIAQIAACGEFPGNAAANKHDLQWQKWFETVKPMSETGLKTALLRATFTKKALQVEGGTCCKMWWIWAGIQ